MKKTPLRRRTALRAKRWGIASKRKPKDRTDDTRHLVLAQSHGYCDFCLDPIRSEDWEDHHVFYRSHVALRVRHQLWNRTALHQGCHKSVHKSPEHRARLEAKALRRLHEYLGAALVVSIMGRMPEGATEPAAFVRAYETYSRSIS